ncbi:MFS transporter [Microbacterium imperiale]|uniref:MFS transporter n=1 Tax=Microbacterium imperiale TaxID=33884 RepID=A0A9W6M2I6_9MICO|nr:MFS transporter [Microbacterium imperiale]MBP2419694.1 MFS family permease [Microbacterium imperiale]MDS0198442.1 MFS transporter [Microbacterium imperiale]BFE40034.1 MFS transporter [Microbacterium imperiale]GLJ78991.1 MFS transporter [Microbacterium imperiale]
MPKVSVRAVVGFLVFCELASGFVQGFYAPLLGEIAGHLQVSDADITWFLTVQTLAAAVCVPLLSKLGDIFGHRRMLRIAVIAVLIGTVVTAFLPSYPIVLIARILVGPLAVWLPLEIALVHSRIKGETARTSIGLLVSCLTGGAILGTISAGLFSALLPSLTLVLLIPVVFVAVSVYAVFFKVPESTSRTDARIDVLGFVGIGLAMVLLLFGLRLASSEGFTAPATVATLGAAVVVFVLWVLWELRSPSPAIDVRLIVSPRLGPVYLTAFLFGMVMFGMQAPTTTFLTADPVDTGYGFAATAGTASAVTAVVTILATVGAATFAPIARRVGIRTVLVTGALAAASGFLIQIAFHDHLWQIFLVSAVNGIGMGFLLGALPALVAELAPSDSTGIATGVYNSLRTLGGSTAGAAFAVVLAGFTASGALHSTIQGYLTIWGICAGAFLVAAVALSFMRMPRATEPVTKG